MNKLFSFSRRSKLLAMIVSVVTLIMVVGVAYAITITVDGTKEAAWNGSGGQTPGSQTDLDETGITNTWTSVKSSGLTIKPTCIS